MGKQRKKYPRRRTPKKKSRLLGWLVLLALLVVSLCATFYLIFLRPGSLPGANNEISTTHVEQRQPLYEEPRQPQPSSIPKRAERREPQNNGKPRVALLIDDIGFKESTCREMIELDLPLSFAFLPFAPHTQTLLALARQRGCDILLHQPMEPLDTTIKPGKGALYISMNDQEITAALERTLGEIPEALGINNHMGSRFTANRRAMKSCLQLLGKKGLFFVDSITSGDSVAYALAREMGLGTARRDLFLDHDTALTSIKKQLDLLVRVAKKNGAAIGIGHPYPQTLAMLREQSAMLKSEVELVGISRLIEK